MPATQTVEDIWELFRETDRRLKEESERRAQEWEHQLRERDEKFARDLQASQELFDRRLQASREEMDRVLKDLSRQVGALGSKWGEFVEGLVAPACEWLFAERGIPVSSVSQRVKAKRPGGRNMEIDILVVNGNAVVLVEVKSRLTVADVRDHMERLAQFKEFFPVYANHEVIGAVAGITSEEGAEAFARNQGMFVIAQSGESVRLANDGDFVPRRW